MRYKSRPVWTIGAISLLIVAYRSAAQEPPRPPALPQVVLETSVASTPVTGQTIEVGPNDDLQAALDRPSRAMKSSCRPAPPTQAISTCRRSSLPESG